MLKNPRHEKFAQELAKGRTADDAYVQAGYKKSRKNAARLRANEDVLSRIEEIQARAAKKAEITVERVLNELAKISFANMRDYIRTTSDGDAFVDLSSLTDDQAAAISEVTVEDFKDNRGEDRRDVRRVKFRLHDKRAALMDIAKISGFIVDKTNLNINGGLATVNLTTDDAHAAAQAYQDMISGKK